MTNEQSPQDAKKPAGGLSDSNAGLCHTPGPWHIGCAGSAVGVNYSVLSRKRGGWVNILKGNEKHDTETRATPTEAHANARLMTAAPDLLAELQELRYACTDKAEAMADAAIAKALGHNYEVSGGGAFPPSA